MNQEERTLRSNIRDLIRIVKQKKANEKDLFENNIFKLATLELEKMLLEGGVPDVDPTPNKSTGINVLEELLKKIVPVLETDFKSLTTNGEQRVSFRAHIVNAVVKTLTPAIANNEADPDEKESAGDGEIDEDIETEEDVNINIIDDLDDDKFIDIRTDAERKAAEDEDVPDEKEEFGAGVEGDDTGRNMAYQSFKKIETSIIDSYELLSDPEDQELFYDYLIANLKLYFNKFEDELSGTVEEPSNQAYDDAVADAEEATGSDDGGSDIDIEL